MFFFLSGMLITITIGFLLAISAIISALGLSISQTCGRSTSFGPILTPGTLEQIDEKALLTMSLRLDPIEFSIGSLTRVQSGFPAFPTSDLCLSCYPDENVNVVSGCSVTYWKMYQQGELEVFVHPDYKFLLRVVTKFMETSGAGIEYTGHGDLIRGEDTFGSFLFSSSSQNVVHLLEYVNTDHHKELSRSARDLDSQISQPTRSPVTVYNISCQESEFQRADMTQIFRGYRTAQLEFGRSSSEFNEAENRFSVDFNEDSVYRAIWAGKATKETLEQGEYFVYGQCGFHTRYDWIHAIPLLSTFVILMLTYMVSVFNKREIKNLILPHLQGWNLQAQVYQISGRDCYEETLSSKLATFWRSLNDQAILKEDVEQNQELMIELAE